MVYIPEDADKLQLTSTYAFGLADPPNLELVTPSIKEISAAFIVNLMRLKSMMTFPAYLADFSGIIQRFHMVAEFEHCGTIKFEEQFHDGPTAKKLFTRFVELFGEHNKKIQALAGDSEKLAAHANDMIEKGGAITVIIAGAPAAINAFEFAMMSYLTSAWTLFETAAGDLWEAALNHRPYGLADLRGEKRYQRRERRRPGDESGKLEKSVRLDLIRAQDWDTKHTMGSILRDKFAFTTLQGIRDAYEVAFYKKADEIDNIVTDNCYDRLSALRNVIVHKGAIADAEYVRRAKDIAGLPILKKGEKIELNGKMVADLVHETSNSTARLIHSVDQWLVTNAIKPSQGDTDPPDG
jgi:hypothetical protein